MDQKSMYTYLEQTGKSMQRRSLLEQDDHALEDLLVDKYSILLHHLLSRGAKRSQVLVSSRFVQIQSLLLSPIILHLNLD